MPCALARVITSWVARITSCGPWNCENRSRRWLLVCLSPIEHGPPRRVASPYRNNGSDRLAFGVQQLPPATPVVLWAGGPFFERAVEHRRHKGPVDGTCLLGRAAYPPPLAAPP